MKRIVYILAVALLAVSLCFFASCGSKAPGDKGNAAAPEVVGTLPAGLKLIRNADLSLETTAYEDTLAGVEAALTAVEGYTTKSYYSSYSHGRYASFTLRVPAARLDEFLAALKNDTAVTISSMRTEVADVTLTYATLSARAETLQGEVEVLERLYAQCTTVAEAQKVEERLTEVKTEWNGIRAQLAVYDEAIAYSTVTLSVEETLPAHVSPVPFILLGAAVIAVGLMLLSHVLLKRRIRRQQNSSDPR